jgi:hypothetical protein
MEEEKRKSGLSIFIYLIPVYILVAVPLAKWTLKNFSTEVEMTQEELSVFNSEEGEIKKISAPEQAPDLADGSLSVRYRSGGSQGGTQEEMNWGYTPGYLSDFIAKNSRNPAAVAELLNNRWTVKGFLARQGVKTALAGKAALAASLGDGAADAFLALPAGRAALSSQAMFDAVTGSDLAKTLLAAPAAQALMADRSAVAEVLEASPRLASLLRRPEIKTALAASPQTAALRKSLGGL